MWKQFVPGIVAFLIIPATTHWLGLGIGNGLLWITGLVVFWYTLETRGLREEMVRQNEMAIQPLGSQLSKIGKFRESR